MDFGNDFGTVLVSGLGAFTKQTNWTPTQTYTSDNYPGAGQRLASNGKYTLLLSTVNCSASIILEGTLSSDPYASTWVTIPLTDVLSNQPVFVYDVVNKTVTYSGSNISLGISGLYASQLFVTVNGVVQQAEYSYTVVGSDLIWLQPPATGSVVFIKSLWQSVDSQMAEPEVRTNDFVGTGSATSFPLTIDVSDASNVLVMINGIVQQIGSSYSISNSQLILSEAPDSGSAIFVRSLTTPYYQAPSNPAPTLLTQPSITLDNQTGNRFYSFQGKFVWIRVKVTNLTKGIIQSIKFAY